MYRKILIAVDEGGPARQAVEAGVELAVQLGASVAVLHVTDVALAFRNDLCITDETMLADLRERGRFLLDATARRVGRSVPCERFSVEGDPGETIVITAREWGADLIVMGSDSRGRLAHFLLGSTADAVIRRAPCPVLTVRQVENREPLQVSSAATVVA